MNRTLLREVLLIVVLVLVFGINVANTHEQVVVPVEVPVEVFPKVQRGSELEMIATAYTYSGDAEDLTFSELPVAQGAIAVDPRVIPLGTVLWVEGYGYGVAIDTGGLIKGHKIDVFIPNKHAASDWGVRHVKVIIIKPPGVDLR